MLIAFLLGLLAVGAITIIVLMVLTVKWLYEKLHERLNANSKYKVAFMDLKESITPEVVEELKKKKKFSMSDLEDMCCKAPYVMADIDMDTGTIMNYTGIKADEVETELKEKIKRRGGVLVVNN